jgi:hypothetical protein
MLAKLEDESSCKQHKSCGAVPLSLDNSFTRPLPSAPPLGMYMNRLSSRLLFALGSRISASYPQIYVLVWGAMRARAGVHCRSVRNL